MIQQIPSLPALIALILNILHNFYADQYSYTPKKVVSLCWRSFFLLWAVCGGVCITCLGIQGERMTSAIDIVKYLYFCKKYALQGRCNATLHWADIVTDVESYFQLAVIEIYF